MKKTLMAGLAAGCLSVAGHAAYAQDVQSSVSFNLAPDPLPQLIDSSPTRDETQQRIYLDLAARNTDDAPREISPYISGGLGPVDNSFLSATTPATAARFAIRGESNALAATIAAGVAWRPAERFELFSEGRYHMLQDIDVERRFSADVPQGRSVVDGADGVTFKLGGRLRF